MLDPSRFMTDDASINPPPRSAPKGVDMDGRAVQKKSERKRWTIWRILVWVLLTLLMLVLIAGAYIWTNRYSFVEDMFTDILSEQGLDADITIDSIGKTGAILNNIDLRADGQSVFSAGRITADYDWRDALSGTVNRLVLTEPKIRITVDEKGKVIDGWLPATDASGQGTDLPKDGIVLNKADIAISSPYGDIRASGDIVIASLEDIKADLIISETALVFKDSNGRLSGRLNVTRNHDIWAADIKANIPEAAMGARRIEAAKITADMRLDMGGDNPVIEGAMKSIFAGLDTNRFQSGRGQADWSGKIMLRSGSPKPSAIDGIWAADVESFSVKDAGLADDLAAKLSLFDTLSATPIAESFAKGLRADVRALFTAAQVQGRGDLKWNPQMMTVNLSAPLTLTTKRTKLKVTGQGEHPFYAFDAGIDRIKLTGDAALSGRYPVSVTALDASVISNNGISFGGIDRVSGRLERANVWATVIDGREVKLAPANVDMRYISGDRRRLMLNGPIDFDGPVPGGYAQGLKAAGRLDVMLRGGNLAASFLPAPASQVQLTRFETLTDWTAENLSFDIIPSEAPLYRRMPQGGVLQTRVKGLKGMLREAMTDRQLLFVVDEVDAKGTLSEGRQDWDMTVSQADIRTDDFLGADTIMTANTAQVSAILTPDNATQIELISAAVNLETPQFIVKDMPFNLRGTTEKFSADYGEDIVQGAAAGRVRMREDTLLPVLPITGTLVYDKGAITGIARTVLPKAENTDINIDYQFKDGQGRAKVIVPDLSFARGSLQPQDFVTSLQGKIADVNGSVSADIDLAFASGRPLQSSGRVRVNNMDFGTLPGPFSGVSTEIDFDSFFPLKTSGQQTLYVDSFNPGLALNDGVIKYELADNGVKIDSAIWPLSGGTLSLDPTLWIYDAPQNRVVVRINDVAVGAFLDKAGGGKLTATGDVVGTIPVVISGVNVNIDNGQLSVENGGVIQYRSQQLKSVVDLIPEKYVTLQDYQQFQQARKNDSLSDNVGKDLAFTALRNFEYKSLSAKLNGPLDGEVEVNLQFEGRNPKILAGTRFAFNINVTGELLNLARSLKVDSGLDRLKGYINMGSDAYADSDVGAVISDLPSPVNDNSLDIVGRSSQIQTEKDIKP